MPQFFLTADTTAASGTTTAGSVQRVFEHGGADPPRLAHQPGELRDDVERLAAGHHLLQLAQLVVEPPGIDRRTRRSEDLRVRGRAHRLAVVPERFGELL